MKRLLIVLFVIVPFYGQAASISPPSGKYVFGTAYITITYNGQTFDRCRWGGSGRIRKGEKMQITFSTIGVPSGCGSQNEFTPTAFPWLITPTAANAGTFTFTLATCGQITTPITDDNGVFSFTSASNGTCIVSGSFPTNPPIRIVQRMIVAGD